MAESGAHLSWNVATAAPTLFEVIAQEKLSSLIGPAIKHVVSVFANRHPSLVTCLPAHKIASAGHLALETHFLLRHGATAAEHFYGLERVNALGGLTNLDKLKSLALVTILPHLKTFAHNYYDDGNRSHRNKWIKTALFYYPYVCSIIQALDLVLYLRYLVGKSRYHSLEQRLSGTILQRARPLATSATGSGGRTATLLRAVGTLVTHSVTAGVFFVQFLHWWQTADNGDRLDDRLPVPAPPSELKQGAGPCAICAKAVTNAAVLSTSGFVFCYPCVYRHVARTGRCPITGYPSSVDDLVRLHVTGS